MSGGVLPLNRPNISGLSFRQQIVFQVFQPLVFFIFLSVIYWLTRRRAIPGMAHRAPDRALAARETLLMWIYGGAPFGVGQVVGTRLLGQGLGWHVNGAPFEIHPHPQAAGDGGWAAH